MIMTTRNITITVEGRNSSEMESAPTGCAASLIHAKANCRAYNTPHCSCGIRKKPHGSTATNTRITQTL